MGVLCTRVRKKSAARSTSFGPGNEKLELVHGIGTIILSCYGVGIPGRRAVKL